MMNKAFESMTDYKQSPIDSGATPIGSTAVPPIKIQENKLEKNEGNLSLCSTLRVEHSLEGYSHREHCRAPDRKTKNSRLENIFTWPLGVAKGS